MVVLFLSGCRPASPSLTFATNCHPTVTTSVCELNPNLSGHQGVYRNEIGMPIAWAREDLPLTVAYGSSLSDFEIGELSLAVTTWNNIINREARNRFVVVFAPPVSMNDFHDSCEPDVFVERVTETTWLSEANEPAFGLCYLFYFHMNTTRYANECSQATLSDILWSQPTIDANTSHARILIGDNAHQRHGLFRRVLLHELGHSLGLRHDHKQVRSIMFVHPSDDLAFDENGLLMVREGVFTEEITLATSALYL